MIAILLKSKADPNFMATRGGCNYIKDYPIFNDILGALQNMESIEQKMKLLQVFMEAGADVNQSQ